MVVKAGAKFSGACIEMHDTGKSPPRTRTQKASPQLFLCESNSSKIGGSSAAQCYFSPMEKPQITAYLKTHCGWSGGVRAVLAKYDLPYTEKDIIQNPAFRWEMETKSGQPLSPCIEINGEMLADVSGEEIERYLIEQKLVQPNEAEAGVPINAPCANEQHGEPVKLRF